MSLSKLLEVERRMKISNFRLIMCTICVCLFLTLQTCIYMIIAFHELHDIV